MKNPEKKKFHVALAEGDRRQVTAPLPAGRVKPRPRNDDDGHDDDPPANAKTKRRPPGGPIVPGQHLLFKPQVLELLGNASYSTLWTWMTEADFPLPIELGKRDGRTTRVAWLASEVYAWIEQRPRRRIGGLKEKQGREGRPVTR